jgi:hypothetical protein
MGGFSGPGLFGFSKVGWIGFSGSDFQLFRIGWSGWSSQGLDAGFSGSDGWVGLLKDWIWLSQDRIFYG